MALRRVLIAACALIGFIAALPLAAQPAESYDDVMLVINERSWASREIGAYFQQRRNIPERNVYRMNIDTSESIDSARFLEVKWQMQAWMRENQLENAINYIVTTKGVPLRVRTRQWDKFDSLGRLEFFGGQCSFEDCLAIMNGPDSVAMLALKNGFLINRYFASTRRFARNPVSLPIYLVTRLDGYTVDQVKGYIQKAEATAVIGEGLWVLDVDPGRDGNPGYRIGNDWLRTARDILTSRGMNVLFNSDTAYVRRQNNVIGYASWGSNDGHSGGREGAIPANTWLNGALAETYVSTGGRTFNPGTTGGQSLIVDWIAEGASGVKGYTDEPYLTSIAHPDILFDRYTSGFNMAESFWAASQFAAWRQVVIGDPKMKLRLLLSASKQEIVFDTTARLQTSTDTIVVTNNLSGPLTINRLSIAGGDSTDFRAEIEGMTTPAPIAAGASFRVIVSFTPTGYGLRGSQLEIAARRPGDLRDYSTIAQLIGRSVQPALVGPARHDFGTVTIGTSSEYSIDLGSTVLSDTIEVTNFSKSGAGSARFSVTPSQDLPSSVTEGSSLSMRVTYAPSGATRDSATLSIFTLNTQPLRIRLYGTGATSSVLTDATLASLSLAVAPNPATSGAELRFPLDRPSHVRVTLVDLLGRTVRELAAGTMPMGEGRVAIDLDGLAAGSYLCRVEITDAAGRTQTHVAPLVRQ